MSDNYLYLAIDVLSISVPLLFSFHPKNNFYQKWRYAWPAILITATVFVIWDQWFTAIGVWGFNPAYLTGLNVFHLPVEEIAFFICVPYSCLFIYDTVHLLHPENFRWPWMSMSIWIFIALLLAIGSLFYRHLYTSVTFVSLALLLVYLNRNKTVPWLGHFLVGYAIILIPFFIVNGILTGTGLDGPVVWYDPVENLNLRIGTIPAEDTFYGMLLILTNVSLFERLKGVDAPRR